MSKTNCVNCGAAKDTSEIKCPFCGTTYLDLTAIDFSSNEPVVCKFVMPNADKKVVLSMLAMPKLNNVSVYTDECYIHEHGSSLPSASFVVSRDIAVGIEFNGVSKRGNDELYTIEIE